MLYSQTADTTIKEVNKHSKITIETPSGGNYLYTYSPFPLPAKKQVNILAYWDIRKNIEDADIVVYDMACKKICSKDCIFINKYDNLHGLITWNINGTKAGIYFITITYGTIKKTIKVIVE